MVNIKGLDKAKVLKALHDNSKAQGLSYLNLKSLSLEECRNIVKTQLSFDYLYGKALKVDISKDTFDPWGYDRENGEGAAQHAINTIK